MNVKLTVSEQEKQEISTAVLAYSIAKTMESDILRIKYNISLDVLTENYYFEDEEVADGEPQRIADPTHDYMMTDSDYSEYIGKCYEKWLAVGIADNRGKEYAPESEAHKMRKQAENCLLDIMQNITAEIIPAKEFSDMRRHWKYRGKLLELCLKLAENL